MVGFAIMVVITINRIFGIPTARRRKQKQQLVLMENLIEIDWYYADCNTGEVFVEDGDLIRPAQLSDFLVNYRDD